MEEPQGKGGGQMETNYTKGFSRHARVLAWCPTPGRNKSSLRVQELAGLMRLKMEGINWRRVLATST